MIKKLFITAAALLASTLSVAGGADDPTLFSVRIDKLELRATDSGSNPKVWDTQAWIGKDLNKLWLKSEGEYKDGSTERAWLQTLYSRAISPFWDAQIGWRHDFRPRPTRDWFALGLQGLAPYFFEVETTLFARTAEDISLRLEAEYDLLFTQKLILSKNDKKAGHGSGLSTLEAGLRLRYEIRREFAPYIGVNWDGQFGNTGDYAKDEGENRRDLQFVVGIRAWF
jgi:copper resistance protein B